MSAPLRLPVYRGAGASTSANVMPGPMATLRRAFGTQIAVDRRRLSSHFLSLEYPYALHCRFTLWRPRGSRGGPP